MKRNKLSFEQACQIRHDYVMLNVTEIAKKWNLPRTTVAYIMSNRVHKIKPLGDTIQNIRVYEKLEKK